MFKRLPIIKRIKKAFEQTLAYIFLQSISSIWLLWIKICICALGRMIYFFVRTEVAVSELSVDCVGQQYRICSNTERSVKDY